jgi:hypothetical protein
MPQGKVMRAIMFHAQVVLGQPCEFAAPRWPATQDRIIQADGDNLSISFRNSRFELLFPQKIENSPKKGLAIIKYCDWGEDQ